MAELSREQAIERARAVLGITPTAHARAWPVQRLDRQNDRYYLVVFDPDQELVAVAAIGAALGELRSAAQLAHAGAPVVLSAEQACELAGLGQAGVAELVWLPCRASLSPLYPLWQVRAADQTRYVDQQGQLWTTLPPAGPGG